MKRIMKKCCTLFIAMGLIVGAAFSQDEDLGAKLAGADSLYDRFEEEKALQAYREILERNPDHYRALWRTSFLYSRIGNRLESESRQLEYYNRAINLAERALEVDSTDTQSHFVMSVALGRKAMISGARERVAASRQIKRHAERAIDLDQTNSGPWHVLGRWHHKVANLNFVERAVANMLFGGIPDADEKKAVMALQKAIDRNGDYILYYRDLAAVYKGMGNDQKAISVCQKALDRELLTPDDPRLKRECRQLIRNLQ